MDYGWSPTASSRLRAPEDGIVASQRARGWLGQRWMALLTGLSAPHQPRVAQGKTYARGGRVRGLWFSPGLASAEVVESEVRRVSVRIRVLEDPEWERVLAVLLSDLTHIGALLEGELPKGLLDALERAGLSLLPTWDDLDSDCDCSDYLAPCPHASAVHHVLADALDGDPFLLLTVRGCPREQLLASLRRAWGDPEPMLDARHELEEEPADDDWFRSPRPLPTLTFDVREAEVPAAGLRALGPPPGGEADLERALLPLYDAGAKAALAIALRETDPADLPKVGELAVEPALLGEEPEPDEDDDMAETIEEAEERGLTELLVDALADVECAKSTELATRLGLDPILVRNELLELEKLGIVYRTGATRGTRWWLG